MCVRNRSEEVSDEVLERGSELSETPVLRIRTANDAAPRRDGAFVLYWMTAYRRLNSNFALQRAVEWSNKLGKPLVILDALRVGYPWASERLHRFILDGMIDNARDAEPFPVRYLSYVERRRGEGSGLAEGLARHACVTVTDDFPCFFHPTLYYRVVARWPSCVELVDSNGILPMRVHDRTFTVAHSYRRAMQKVIAGGMPQFPAPNPLAQLGTPKLQHLPGELGERWRFESAEGLEQIQLSQLPIDHTVRSISQRGGRRTGTTALKQFSQGRLSRYNEERNVPDRSGSSALSPFLHFGHVSSHEVYQAIIDATPDWSLEALGKPNGKMNGFWNLDENSEAFLDQLLTWREIGFNLCSRESNYEAYESLPDWAQKTLAEHETDPRPYLYHLEQFEHAKTHDELWNAAQRQLVREGRMHNYLRMLWGKKILHWTRSPREALSVMIELNNKYALDGRDPNSYSGIFWVLGRYDRAWGPERPVFGKIRYMTSESTRSKVSVKDYLKRYADA